MKFGYKWSQCETNLFLWKKLFIIIAIVAEVFSIVLGGVVSLLRGVGGGGNLDHATSQLRQESGLIAVVHESDG